MGDIKGALIRLKALLQPSDRTREHSVSTSWFQSRDDVFYYPNAVVQASLLALQPVHSSQNLGVAGYSDRRDSLTESRVSCKGRRWCDLTWGVFFECAGLPDEANYSRPLKVSAILRIQSAAIKNWH
jgi:hypothetical protein